MRSRIAVWEPTVPGHPDAPAPVAIGLSPTGPAVVLVEHLVAGVPPIRCTSYVTRGLRELGHDELVFTLRTDRKADQGSVLQPIDLFRLIHWRITCGARLGPGALVGQPLARALDWPSVTGFAFERTWATDGVDVPRGALVMVALLGPEYELAVACGPARVLSRLAAATSCFPTASWCDLDRKPVATAGELSRLARTSTLHLPGVTATCEPEALYVRIARSTRPALARAIDHLKAPFALIAGLDPRADARLAWRPGQDRPRGLRLPGLTGAHLAGCFVAFVDGPTDRSGILEDGFVVQLTDGDLLQLRAAIREGAPLELPAVGARGLRLEWIGDQT